MRGQGTKQLRRLYRWGNDRQDLGPIVRFSLLVGLVCLTVGAVTQIPEIWIAGLVVIFFVVPLVYLREKMRYWIQDHLGNRDAKK